MCDWKIVDVDRARPVDVATAALGAIERGAVEHDLHWATAAAGAQVDDDSLAHVRLAARLRAVAQAHRSRGDPHAGDVAEHIDERAILELREVERVEKLSHSKSAALVEAGEARAARPSVLDLHVVERWWQAGEREVALPGVVCDECDEGRDGLIADGARLHETRTGGHVGETIASILVGRRALTSRLDGDFGAREWTARGVTYDTGERGLCRRSEERSERQRAHRQERICPHP